MYNLHFDIECDKTVNVNEKNATFCDKQRIINKKNISNTIVSRKSNVQLLQPDLIQKTTITINSNIKTSFFLVGIDILQIQNTKINLTIIKLSQNQLASIQNNSRFFKGINTTVIFTAIRSKTAAFAQTILQNGSFECSNVSLTVSLHSDNIAAGFFVQQQQNSSVSINTCIGSFSLNMSYGGVIGNSVGQNTVIAIWNCSFIGNITTFNVSRTGLVFGNYSTTGSYLLITQTTFCFQESSTLQYCANNLYCNSQISYHQECNASCLISSQQKVYIYFTSKAGSTQSVIYQGNLNNTILNIDKFTFQSEEEISIFYSNYSSFTNICVQTSQTFILNGSLILLSSSLSVSLIGIKIQLNISIASTAILFFYQANFSTSELTNITLSCDVLSSNQGGFSGLNSSTNGNTTISNLSVQGAYQTNQSSSSLLCNNVKSTTSTISNFTIAMGTINSDKGFAFSIVSSDSSIINYISASFCFITQIINSNSFCSAFGTAANSSITFETSIFQIQAIISGSTAYQTTILASCFTTNLTFNTTPINITITDISMLSNFTVLATDNINFFNSSFLINITNNSNTLYSLRTVQNISFVLTSINVSTLAQKAFYGVVWNLTKFLNVSNCSICINSSQSTLSAGLIYTTANSSISINNTNCSFNLSNGNYTTYLGSVISQAIQNVTLIINNSQVNGTMVGNNSTLLGGIVGQQVSITMTLQNTYRCFSLNVADFTCAQSCNPTQINLSMCGMLFDCAGSSYVLAFVSLSTLTNISNVFIGFNVSGYNNSYINMSNINITNNTNFSTFGSQQIYNQIQIVGNITQQLNFSGCLTSQTQLSTSYSCVQYLVSVNIINTSTLYFFQYVMQNSSMSNVLLNMTFNSASTGSFAGANTHSAGNSSFLSLITDGNYATTQNSCSLVFRTISNSTNITFMNCTIQSNYSIQSDGSKHFIGDQTNATVFVNNSMLLVRGSIASNINTSACRFGYNILSAAAGYYQNCSFQCYLAVAWNINVFYIYQVSAVLLINSSNFSSNFTFNSTYQTATGVIFLPTTSSNTTILDTQSTFLNFSTPVGTAYNCQSFTNKLFQVTNYFVKNMIVFISINNAGSYSGFLGSHTNCSANFTNISLSGQQTYASSGCGYSSAGFIGYVYMAQTNITNVSSNFNMTSIATYVGGFLGYTYSTSKIIIVQFQLVSGNYVFSQYQRSGVIIGYSQTETLCINDSKINISISVGTGTYGIAIVTGYAMQLVLNISNLSVTLNIVQSNTNLSAVYGFSEAGVGDGVYTISNFGISPIIPCFYHIAGWGVSSTKSSSNCT